MAGISLKEQNFTSEIIPKHYSVKESVFPFNKFLGVDPFLGPEMRSTGEVMGSWKDFPAAFDKAFLAAGDVVPSSGKVLVSLRTLDRGRLVELGERLISQVLRLLLLVQTKKFSQKLALNVQWLIKYRKGLLIL